jgi:hypothetical protein
VRKIHAVARPSRRSLRYHRSIAFNEETSVRALNAAISAAAIFCAGAGGVHAETDLKVLATSITTSAHTNTERVSAVIGWAHSHLDWLSSDYQTRTVQEVLDRKGRQLRRGRPCRDRLAG